jgi:hypothetical protein
MDEKLINNSNPIKYFGHRRVLADVAAVILHLISVSCVMALNTDFADDTQGRVLCAMEAITIISHIIYLIRYNNNYNEWQLLKWLEYAFRLLSLCHSRRVISNQSL